MNILKGLYFPGTVAGGSSFDSLLCLLDTIDYYRIIEENELPADPQEEPSSWQGQVVAPLGKDRERFLAMIRDVRLYGAEFYENCLAGMSADPGLDQDESSVWQLAASLYGGKDAGRKKILLAKLWRARVVLKLAEILAAEQAGIDKGLAAVRQGELQVFSGLKGDEGDAGADDLFTPMDGAMSGARPVKAGKVLPAWSVFHAFDSHDHPLLVTDNGEAAAILFDVLEQVSGKGGQLLVELQLPTVSSSASLEQKRAELADSRQAVAGALAKIIAGEGAAGLTDLQHAAAGWQKNVGQEKQPAGCTFALYLISGDYMGKVWDRISGLSGDKTWSPVTLVGVLGGQV